MNLNQIKYDASRLFSEARFIAEIKTDIEHQLALELVENLIEDYDENESLIDLLSRSIERWESTSEEFAEFNDRVSGMGNGVAVLKTLMDQYSLGVNDFENEIGGKSIVSLITNNKRQLTLGHIHALAKRFKLDPKTFV
jgi:HTH-type transcriptional regulator/antitoxin HigA